MPKRTDPKPVDLFGTSVGAFKLSASARKDPGAALLATAKAYVEQSYKSATSLAAIDEQTSIVLDKVFAPHTQGSIDEILSNERYRLHIGTVRCHGGLNSTNRARQGLALARAGAFGYRYPTPFTWTGRARRVLGPAKPTHFHRARRLWRAS